MFEDEHRESTKRPTRLDYVMSDAALLLPPAATPLTGIDFAKRLPCGEVRFPRYTLFDESGTAQNFDIVPLSTHRQTYRQTDTLQHPRILISSHSGCPTLVKKRVLT